MKNKFSYEWLLIPLTLLVFLYEMALVGKVPLASDTMSIQPIKEWVKEYTSTHDDFPHWYPHLFSGMPSYGSYVYTPGNPLSGIINFILFNRGLQYWFYFAIGGLGVFCLLRRKKVSSISALMGGLTYSLTPYFFGLINAGHSTKIMSLGYFPLVFLFAEYCLSDKNLRGILLLAIFSALQLWSNHPQIVYYTWMIVFFRWLWSQVGDIVNKKWTLKSDGKSTGLIFAGLLVALVIVSDPYVSVFEFQQHSNRGAPSVLDRSGETASGAKWDYAAQWSFHPKELISFLYPYFYGLQNYPTQDIKSVAYWGGMPFTQSTHYFGLLVILIAILGALLKKPDRFQAFLWVTTLLILLVGFGKYFPVLFGPLYYYAPFFSKFRVPSMIYAMLPFTFGILGAFGLDTIIKQLKDLQPDQAERLKKFLLFVFGGFIALTLFYLLIGSSWVSFFKADEAGKYNPQIIQRIKDARQDLFQKGLLLALVVSGGAFAALWFGIKRRIKPHVVGWIIIALTLGDLWVIDNEFLYLKDARKMDRQFRPNAVTRYLTKDKDHFRIYPVDEFSTNWYGYFGLASVGGYRPVKLRTYQDLMDAGGLNSLAVLNMLNVKYLIMKREFNHPDVKLVLPGDKKIYENKAVLPKAWIVPGIINVSSQKESLKGVLDKNFNPRSEAIVVNYDGPLPDSLASGNVTVTKCSENEIILKSNATSSGLLVLSEMFYEPGWLATVDGKPTKIYQTNHILRSVVVPAGEHEVRFLYNSRKWWVTRIISRISLLVAVVSLGIVYRGNILALVKRKQ